jgi:hypothetical protein
MWPEDTKFAFIFVENLFPRGVTMMTKFHEATNTQHSAALRWTAYAAAIWAFLFAALSFLRALDGPIGLETIGPAIADLADDPLLITVLWITGLIILVAGLLPLGLVQSWGRVLPRRIWLGAVWISGVGILLRGVTFLIVHALEFSTSHEIVEGIERTAALWRLFFWDPFWILGGVLFMATAVLASRYPQVRETGHTTYSQATQNRPSLTPDRSHER